MKTPCTNGCMINSTIGGDYAYCECACHAGTLPAIPPSRERRRIESREISDLRRNAEKFLVLAEEYKKYGWADFQLAACRLAEINFDLIDLLHVKQAELICNPPVITAEQFIALAQRLRDAGCPTTGRDAFLLWEWSNREEIRGDLAISEMKKLGYKPLSGFPLQRLQRYAFSHNELAGGWTKFANSQMEIV